MLHCKDIKNIWELKSDFTNRWLEPDYLLSVLGVFHFSNLIKQFTPMKSQGYRFDYVLSILLSLPFINIPNVSSLETYGVSGKKDVFYRLKNNFLIDWRAILWLFAQRFTKIMQDKAKVNNEIKCLIIDDSLLEKTGKFMEKVSRVWDHVSQRSLLGFKLNLMGYWDGFSFIPIDFSFHRERGKNKNKPYGLKKKHLRKQFTKKRPKDTASYKRVKEADQTKIETGIKMFKRAIKKGLVVDYLLMDSWFTCNAFIEVVREVKNQTVHLIGMYKIAKTKFEYKGEWNTYSQIRNLAAKQKRNRKTGFYYKEAVVLLDGEPVKLFFSRKGKRGNWKTFISTNIKLSFIQMLEIYNIRWTIEVFFKECKQLFGLGKDQANDFDSQIAATTLSMLQHILITTRYRFENYESKGALFRQAQVEMFNEKLTDRLWVLLIGLISIIIELFEDIDENKLMEKILSNEEAYQKIEKLITYSRLAA